MAGSHVALEDPISREPCAARILNVFEGVVEIQAQGIARRLVEDELTELDCVVADQQVADRSWNGKAVAAAGFVPTQTA